MQCNVIKAINTWPWRIILICLSRVHLWWLGYLMGNFSMGFEAGGTDMGIFAAFKLTALSPIEALTNDGATVGVKFVAGSGWYACHSGFDSSVDCWHVYTGNKM